MTRIVKISLAVGGIVVVLPMVAIIMLFIGIWLIEPPEPSPVPRREITLANQGTLIIDGNRTSRSEHGFSQKVGYRPPGSTGVEWFGETCDGAEPQVHQAGPLLVVIDLPSACLFIRNPDRQEKWKTFALIFPNDLGPFPISFYAEKNGLTTAEVSRISDLGGIRDRKYPTTYIQNFDPATRDLNCSYQVDNQSAWPLRLRLSEDGTRLALIGIGGSSR